MAGIPATSFHVSFAIQSIGTIIYLFRISKLINSLKASHVRVWASLGSPSLLLNNRPGNSWLLVRWLWAKGYSELNDPDIERRARVVRALLLALCVNFGILLLLLFSARV